MIMKIKVFQNFNVLKTMSNFTQLTTLFHVTTQMIVMTTTFWTRLQKKENTMLTTEDEDDMPEFRYVTNQEAKKYIVGLRIYFMQESNNSSLIATLTARPAFVRCKQLKNLDRTHLINVFINK